MQRKVYRQRLVTLTVFVAMFVLAACSQQSNELSLEPLALSTPESDYASDVAVVGPNFFVVGATYGSLDGNKAGASDVFVPRYSTDGTLIWGRQFGTSGSDSASYVATSSNDDVYVLGLAATSLTPRVLFWPQRVSSKTFSRYAGR